MNRFRFGEADVVYRTPPTTRDILDYRVWVATVEDATQQLIEAAHWAARFIESPAKLTTAVGIVDYIEEMDESEGWEPGDDDCRLMAVELYRMCNAIANSASLPDSVIDGFRALLDKQNGIDPQWQPKSPCDCPKCRRGLAELPPGSRCLYGDAGDLVMTVAAFAGGLKEGEADDPYYLTQIRAVQRRAESRMMAHSREKKDEKAESDAVWQSKLGKPGKRNFG